MRRRLRLVLLCEGVEDEQLFRPVLERLFRKHGVHIRVVHGKRNGGFTFVFSRLEAEARYVRQRPTESVGLLVVVDGDQFGHKRRLDKIQEILQLAGFETKDKMPDRIAACIPSRNVETWKLWLCGFRDLDEHNDFKARFDREVKQGIRRGQLTDAWIAPLDEKQRRAEQEILPAIAHGRAEINRLKKLARG